MVYGVYGRGLQPFRVRTRRPMTHWGEGGRWGLGEGTEDTRDFRLHDLRVDRRDV